jgi:hypothetical protein
MDYLRSAAYGGVVDYKNNGMTTPTATPTGNSHNLRRALPCHLSDRASASLRFCSSATRCLPSVDAADCQCSADTRVRLSEARSKAISCSARDNSSRQLLRSITHVAASRLIVSHCAVDSMGRNRRGKSRFFMSQIYVIERVKSTV